VEPTQAPSEGYAQFDRLCAKVEDWEPLPEFTNALPTETPEEGDGPLDEQIMAGLVSPL
jgi:hypothetical protein